METASSPRFMSILDFSLKSLVNDIVRRVFLRFDIQFHVENPRPLPNIPEIRFRRFNQGFRVGFLVLELHINFGIYIPAIRFFLNRRRLFIRRYRFATAFARLYGFLLHAKLPPAA